MFLLYDTELHRQDYIELPVFSPFVQTGAALSIKMLYFNGRILWFDKHIKRLTSAARDLNLPLDPPELNLSDFLKLIQANNLKNTTALIKTICLELDDGCHIFAFAMKYSIQTQPITVALHPEAHTSSLRRLPLLRYEDFALQELYAEKYGANQVFFTNFKQQVISVSNGNIIAIKYKNLYFVHRSQPYFEHFIQEFILRNASRLGIKKVLDKNKGLPQKFIQQADEVLYINDLLNIRTIAGYYNQNGTFFELGQKGWSQVFRENLFSLLYKKGN